MEKISSGFFSDVLQLLSLNSVIHAGFWKQQNKSAAEHHQVVLMLKSGSLADGVDTRTRAESVGNVTELNSLY